MQVNKGKKKISLPRPLWKLHGRQPCVIDLVLTWTMAVLAAFMVILTMPPVAAWKKILLVIVALDLGGGIISNLTRSTNEHYRSSRVSPAAFVWSHALQGAGLALAFTVQAALVAVTVVLVLAIATFVRKRNDAYTRRLLGMFCFSVLSLVLMAAAVFPLPLLILLHLLAFKLIVAFAITWN